MQGLFSTLFQPFFNPEIRQMQQFGKCITLGHKIFDLLM